MVRVKIIIDNQGPAFNSYLFSQLSGAGTGRLPDRMVRALGLSHVVGHNLRGKKSA
jgi:hypothetical protein